MSVSSDSLLTATGQALDRLAPPDARLCVAFSGGLDSTVVLNLLHLLRPGRLRAVHVNHGLQGAAGDWAAHCARVAAGMGVEHRVLSVDATPAQGESLEAAARRVRYEALAQHLEPEEWLITGQHRQDQLETVLLALLRGSGVHGLAAMPAKGIVHGCRVLRPLLDREHAELQGWAQSAGLEWIDDPSNSDTAFDRNFLRHRVLPQLLERWPGAARAAARSARHCADAMAIVDLAAADNLAAASAGDCLSVTSLLALDASERRHVLRQYCRDRSLPVPSELQLDDALDALLTERADAEPLAAWPGVRFRRYRGYLWCFTEGADPGANTAEATNLPWDGQRRLDMGNIRGALSLVQGTGAGIDPAVAGQRMQVRFRSGGEVIRPAAGASTRQFKKLLQEEGVLPWMRGHIPLLYLDEQLLAAGDQWVNFDHPGVVEQGGLRVSWQPECAWRNPFRAD